MLGHFLKPEYEELIARKDWESLRVAFEDLHPADIAEVLDDLPPEDSGVIFRILPREVAGTAFEYLPIEQQAGLVKTLGSEQLVNVLNGMSPDDRTRLFEELPAEVTRRALTTLNPDELKAARQLLGYPEGTAGRFMTPEYLTLKSSMTAREALDFIRANGRGRETLNVLYVVDDKGALLYDVRLPDLVLAPPETKIEDLIDRQLVSIPATAKREEVVAAFEKYDRVVLPVTDTAGVIVGIITVDDVLDIAEDEATEDMQKLGGMEALEAPYMDIGFFRMMKKRAGWLSALLFGQMGTAIAVGFFSAEIARVAVLFTFLPLIISSGGNSGSQATSLVIRALAIRELELKDWIRVLRREVLSGLVLGVVLGSLAAGQIFLLDAVHAIEAGPMKYMIAVTVTFAVIGVVMLGTMSGAMLPFLLRRFGLDPATASAPAVATLVDVGGVVIYFVVALVILL